MRAACIDWFQDRVNVLLVTFVGGDDISPLQELLIPDVAIRTTRSELPQRKWSHGGNSQGGQYGEGAHGDLNGSGCR
jgi:hypothetical protein